MIKIWSSILPYRVWESYIKIKSFFDFNPLKNIDNQKVTNRCIIFCIIPKSMKYLMQMLMCNPLEGIWLELWICIIRRHELGYAFWFVGVSPFLPSGIFCAYCTCYFASSDIQMAHETILTISSSKVCPTIIKVPELPTGLCLWPANWYLKIWIRFQGWGSEPSQKQSC